MKLSDSVIYIDNLFLTNIFGINDKRYFSKLLRWISHSANGYYYPAIPLALIFLEPDTGILFLMTALIAFAIELPAYKIIKQTVKRIRPYEVRENIANRIIPADRFSLPSGHTSAACIITIILAYFYPILSAPLVVWALLVGISRVYLGVHYPTDILAGIGLGALSAVSAILIAG